MRLVLALLVTLFFVTPLHARWKPEYAYKYTPAEQQWFRQQKVPVDPRNGESSGGSCCSVADGEVVEEDIRNGQYWIKCPIDSGCPFKDWTQVPDQVVIKEPNKLGRPVVWWMGNSIHCYAPGAGF